MFQAHEPPVTNKASAVSLQQAILFAIGVLVTVFSALLVQRYLKDQSGAGWVYLGTTSLRMLALLAGCTVVYLVASPGAGPLIGAYALGIAAAWLGHFVVALVRLRE